MKLSQEKIEPDKVIGFVVARIEKFEPLVTVTMVQDFLSRAITNQTNLTWLKLAAMNDSELRRWYRSRFKIVYSDNGCAKAS